MSDENDQLAQQDVLDANSEAEIADDVGVEESVSNIDAVTELQPIIEAVLLAAGEPLSLDRLQQLFLEDDAAPSKQEITEALQHLQNRYQEQQHSFTLVELANGYCLQTAPKYSQWIARLWEEKPPRYSRALLETLVIMAYRQPVTRAEVEEIRGVAVSSQMVHTLLEREWIKVLGHREVPGRPAVYGTTKTFLDYFNLKSLEELPTLEEIKAIDAAEQAEKQAKLEAKRQREEAKQLSLDLQQAEEAVVVEPAAEIQTDEIVAEANAETIQDDAEGVALNEDDNEFDLSEPEQPLSLEQLVAPSAAELSAIATVERISDELAAMRSGNQQTDTEETETERVELAESDQQGQN